MPVATITTGPGVLTIGEAGTLTDLAIQVTKVTLKPSVKRDDPIRVLSGDSAPGDREETWTLEGDMLQDLGLADSVTEFCFTNRGVVFPFAFTPTTAGTAAKKFTGSLVVEAQEIGGEVGKRATSAFEFPLVDAPALVALVP